jgi:cation transport ATPase
MELIMVLRAKITSLAVAALWSCADAIQLVASTAAASEHPIATAVRRRKWDEFCFRLVTFHLLADAAAISQIR